MGTLETWAESKISEHRWRLQFQLRKNAAAADERAVPRFVPAQSSVHEAQAQAEALIEQVFGDPTSGLPPEQFPRVSNKRLALGRALVAARDDCAPSPTNFWPSPTAAARTRP